MSNVTQHPVTVETYPPAAPPGASASASAGTGLAGVLAPERSEGGHSVSCVAGTAAASPPQAADGRDGAGAAPKLRTKGYSIPRLAKALAQEVLAVVAGNRRAYSFDLTVGGPASETMNQVREALPAFLARVERRFPGGGLIASLDLHVQDGRVHLHGLLLAPLRLSPQVVSDRLVKSWIRLWPYGHSARPARKGNQQFVRPAEPKNIEWILHHHLGGRRRHGLDIPQLGTVYERTHACGVLDLPWRRVAAALHVVGAPAPDPAPEPAPAPRPILPHQCRWCGSKLPSDLRSDAKWCTKACRVSAARALNTAVARNDPRFRERVAEYESKHWSRRDAIRLAAVPEFILKPDLSRLRCRCGAELPRLGARTCGDPACRAEHQRVVRAKLVLLRDQTDEHLDAQEHEGRDEQHEVISIGEVAADATHWSLRVPRGAGGDMTWRDQLEQVLAAHGAPRLAPGALDTAPRPTPEPRPRRTVESESDLGADVREMRGALDMLRRMVPRTFATQQQAADALGVSLSTIRRRVRDGSLPYKRIGRAVRVDLAGMRPRDAYEIAELAHRAREK